MFISRRHLLQSGAAFVATPAFAQTQTPFAPRPGAWRHFEIVTRVDIAPGKAPAQVWVPVPSVNEGEWFRSTASRWTTNAMEAAAAKDPTYGGEMIHARFAPAEHDRSIEITSRFSTRDRAIDLTRPRTPAPLAAWEKRVYTASTTLIRTDGIVKRKSDEITRGAAGDLQMARKIYEWIVENTFREATTRGCGTGDVASMLETGNLGGKCADLNALFVGLARAAGLPARDIYGLRVAPSKFGYRSLGANAANVSKSQHCRAEVWLEAFGWTPVDPADVRKVILEEPPGNLRIDDAKVVAARATLFGAWEGNWLAYNFAHDVALPGAKGGPVDFLMYPQGEIGGERLDSLDPDAFKYAITAKEIEAI